MTDVKALAKRLIYLGSRLQMMGGEKAVRDTELCDSIAAILESLPTQEQIMGLVDQLQNAAFSTGYEDRAALAAALAPLPKEGGKCASAS